MKTKHVELVCKARPGKEPGRYREDQSDSAWEADPRRAELAIQGLGLAKARARRSPGGAKMPGGDKVIELENDAKSTCRAATARLSYIASNMPKLHLATEECGRATTCASQTDLAHLLKIVRFLLKKLQCV